MDGCESFRAVERSGVAADKNVRAPCFRVLFNRVFSTAIPIGILVIVCALASARVQAALPLPPPRTNLPPVAPGKKAPLPPVVAPTTPKTAPKTNALPTVTKAGSKTNAPAGTASTSAGIAQFIKNLPANRAFYPVLGVIAVCIAGLVALKLRKRKPGAPTTGASAEASHKVVRLPRIAARKVAVHSCNVLQLSAEGRRFWQFDARGGRFVLSRELATLGSKPPPSSMVAKSWSSLWQPKLNVACLPPDQVFLRVVHLPQSDFDETLSMVELQLEKLSPIPVAQVAWSLQILAHADPNMQTVVVTIAPLNIVEEHLGQLEGQGYLADRLEVSVLDQLQATPINEDGDGAWIYPAGAGGHGSALVAWWSRGMLQNLDLVTLPPANRPASLKEQLTQMSWAGEMEGWLTSPPVWHLVADAPTAQEWEPALRAGLEQPIGVQAPVAATELAALTAWRASQAEPRANLMPADFAVRYHQQFVDRLWMRGLGAVLLLYLAGLAVYGIALGVATVRTQAIESDAAHIGSDYTNAVQLKAKLDVLKERSELKYAALECYKAIAEKLPEGVTLDSVNLRDGRKLTLNGTAPSGQFKVLLDFQSDLRKTKDAKGDYLFDQKSGDITQHPGIPASIMNWSLSLDLQRTEAD